MPRVDSHLNTHTARIKPENDTVLIIQVVVFELPFWQSNREQATQIRKHSQLFPSFVKHTQTHLHETHITHKYNTSKYNKKLYIKKHTQKNQENTHQKIQINQEIYKKKHTHTKSSNQEIYTHNQETHISTYKHD